MFEYCKDCGGCGEVGCDGIKSFLKAHIKNKTTCEWEDAYLEDILEVYKEYETNSYIKTILDGIETKFPDRESDEYDAGCADTIKRIREKLQ